MSRDLLFGIFTFSVTLLFQIGLLNSKSKTFDVGGLSSVAFPQMVLIVLFVLSIIQIIVGLKGNTKDILISFKSIDKRKYIVPISSLFILTFYIMLIKILGFYTSTFAYIFCTAIFLVKERKRKIMSTLFVSIGTTAVVYLVFSVWLKLLLPTGILL